MSNAPDNKIPTSDIQHMGQGTGLCAATATEEQCSSALFCLSQGHAWLTYADEKLKLVDDGSDDGKSVVKYYELHLTLPKFSQLEPLEGLARIINELARDLDQVLPTPLGVPTRMQSLWLIQNESEITR